MNVRFRSTVGAGERSNIDVPLDTTFRQFFRQKNLMDPEAYTITCNGSQVDLESSSELDSPIPPDALISVVPAKVEGARKLLLAA